MNRSISTFLSVLIIKAMLALVKCFLILFCKNIRCNFDGSNIRINDGVLIVSQVIMKE